MGKLTEEQFLDLYGEAKVAFSSYYKYSFYFTGEFEGKQILVRVGGIASDIYKFDVTAGEEYTISSLCPNYGNVKDGENIIANFDSDY